MVDRTEDLKDGDTTEGLSKLNYLQFSKIQSKPINWFWENRIALGKVTLFAGEPGVGKSQLLLHFASLASKGGTFFPDGSLIAKGKVAILSAEDDVQDTIKPRLIAAGALLDNVYYFQGTAMLDADGNTIITPVSLDMDILKIDHILSKLGNFSLFIIDPISAFLGDINDHKNSEVRTLLSKLTMIAEKHNLAMIINTHLSKPKGTSTTQTAMNRINGSIAYSAAARAAYLITKDTDNPDLRLFIPVKNNIGLDTDGFSYTIKQSLVENNIKTSCIEWTGDRVELTANEAVEGNGQQSASKKQEAMDFLVEFLTPGCQPVYLILEESDKRCIARATLYRAKKDLNVIEEKSIDYKLKKVWFLPSNFTFPGGELRH